MPSSRAASAEVASVVAASAVAVAEDSAAAVPVEAAEARWEAAADDDCAAAHPGRESDSPVYDGQRIHDHSQGLDLYDRNGRICRDYRPLGFGKINTNEHARLPGCRNRG
ncbi:hypothetical protein D3C86_1761640 [compost metagenome]